MCLTCTVVQFAISHEVHVTGHSQASCFPHVSTINAKLIANQLQAVASQILE